MVCNNIHKKYSNCGSISLEMETTKKFTPLLVQHQGCKIHKTVCQTLLFLQYVFSPRSTRQVDSNILLALCFSIFGHHYFYNALHRAHSQNLKTIGLAKAVNGMHQLSTGPYSICTHILQFLHREIHQLEFVHIFPLKNLYKLVKSQRH